MPDALALVVMGAVGVIAGLVAATVFWRFKLGEACLHNEYLMRCSTIGKEVERSYETELLYWQALATRDPVFLDALGARAGMLTASDGTAPWATAEARKRAAMLYESARRHLAELEAGGSGA